MWLKKILVVVSLFFAQIGMGADSQRHQQVDGISIYLGVIPAQLIREHTWMHGGAADKEDSFHILVALFDAKSGERVTDATVKATVSPLGMRGETKILEPMRNELLSYGNYFVLKQIGRYRITIEIERPGQKRKIIGNFAYDRLD